MSNDELWCVLARVIEEADPVPTGLVERAQGHTAVEWAWAEPEAA